MDTKRLSVGARARAFSLMDVLVSIFVIGILVSLLVPGLSRAREATRRVVCASNQRQVGLAMHLYAEDRDGLLPTLEAYEQSGLLPLPSETLYVRYDFGGFLRAGESPWDGLGHLYAAGVIGTGEVFYCPSHDGSHAYEKYSGEFSSRDGDIVTNYQYRGVGPDGQQRLAFLNPVVALASDGLESIAEINHQGGMNVLRAGLHVRWFRDPSDAVTLAMAADGLGGGAGGGFRGGEPGDPGVVIDPWTRLDQGDEARD